MEKYILISLDGVSAELSRKQGYQNLVIKSCYYLENKEVEYEESLFIKEFSYKDIILIKKNIEPFDILKCNSELLSVKHDIHNYKLISYEKVQNCKELLVVKNELLKDRFFRNDIFYFKYRLIDYEIYTKCFIEEKEVDVSMIFNKRKNINQIDENIHYLSKVSSKLLKDIDLYHIKQFIASKLINEVYDENCFTIDSFISRISIECFSIYHDLTYTFTFDDGDLFYGHAVHAEGKVGIGLTRAYMQ